jgi:hypothetical protein
MPSRRPVPQASSSVGGKLVSLSVDYNDQQSPQPQPNYSEMPALVPLDTDGEEKTMLWSNIARLFMKCEQNEDIVKDNTRVSDEIYQELMEIKDDIAQVQIDITENNVLSKHVRKLRKYVNKKCTEVRENLSYGSYNSSIEIFAYIDKVRGEFDARIKKLECENVTLREEIQRVHETYDSDYNTFVLRENDLMAKLECAIHTTEILQDRVKDYEETSMRQIHEARNCAEQQIQNMAGDLREEFTRAICHEMEHVSGEIREEIRGEIRGDIREEIRDEYTKLVTLSNQYHSHRYFGTVEDIKQIRENLQTLKQTIGMVDAELSDTKEVVEFLKDEVAQGSNDIYNIKEDMQELKTGLYREMDRDYQDMKSYVKRSIQRHRKQEHSSTPLPLLSEKPDEKTATDQNVACDAIQMIVNEYDDENSKKEQENHHIIIIDENTVFSDDE